MPRLSDSRLNRTMPLPPSRQDAARLPTRQYNIQTRNDIAGHGGFSPHLKMPIKIA